jgi:hypothetical protein
MISFASHVCAIAERRVSAIHFSALYAGIRIDIKGCTMGPPQQFIAGVAGLLGCCISTGSCCLRVTVGLLTTFVVKCVAAASSQLCQICCMEKVARKANTLSV